MKPCSRCGKALALDITVCPHCGEPQSPNSAAFEATLMAGGRSPSTLPPITPRPSTLPPIPSPSPALADENKATYVMSAAPDFGPQDPAAARGATAKFNPSPEQLPRTRLHAATPAIRAPTPPDAGGQMPRTRLQKVKGEPSGGHRPPVLASESLREDIFPTEPGRRAIRLVYAIAGLLLAGAFVLPVSLGTSPRFAWDLLGQLDSLGFVWTVYPAAAAVLTWAAAALPLPYVVRGLLGLLVALATPVLLGLGAIKLPGGQLRAFEPWRLGLLAASVAVLPAIWLHRHRYRKSVLARLLGVTCALAMAAPLFVPLQSKPLAGQIPLLALFQLPRGLPAAIIVCVYLALGATAFLTLLPSSTRAGGGFFAVLALALTPALLVLAQLGIAECPKGAAGAAVPLCGDPVRLLVARLTLFVAGIHLLFAYGLAHVLAPLSTDRNGTATVGRLTS